MKAKLKLSRSARITRCGAPNFKLDQTIRRLSYVVVAIGGIGHKYVASLVKATASRGEA